jgi:hypothetical protein
MYRRNSDSQLRNLERDYATTRDRLLLQQIDQIRHRSGLLPHPATRIAVAAERIHEYNYQCFQIVRDLRVYLDQIFEGSVGVRLLSDEINERQYLPNLEHSLETRRLADAEIHAVVGGRPPAKQWLQYITSRGITMPPQGEMQPGHEHSMAPHMHKKGAEERAKIAADIRDEIDNFCHDWLEELVRLGLFNAGDLLTAIEDEEAVTEVLLGIEEVLYNKKLAEKELLLARLGEDPPGSYQEEIGNKHWWRD